MLNLMKMISDLRKEVETLRKEVQTLKDALAKQKRDYNDLFYNLDGDNIPSLVGVVKEIRLISETGITLEGKEIDLNAGKGITITSPNFKVTREGKLVCDLAEILSGCILASDISEGKAMAIGKSYTDEGGNTSISEISVNKIDDYSLGESRGIVIGSTLKRGTIAGDGATLKGEVEINGKVVEIRLPGGGEYDDCAIGLKRDEGQGTVTTAYLRHGNQALWLDGNGVHTTAPEIDTGAIF